MTIPPPLPALARIGWPEEVVHVAALFVTLRDLGVINIDDLNVLEEAGAIHFFVRIEIHAGRAICSAAAGRRSSSFHIKSACKLWTGDEHTTLRWACYSCGRTCWTNSA